MSMNMALGLAFGQKIAEGRGVTDLAARRRAGVALAATGLTPVGLVLTKTMLDRQLALEAALAAPADGDQEQPEDTGGKPRDEGLDARIEKAVAAPLARLEERLQGFIRTEIARALADEQKTPSGKAPSGGATRS